MLLFEYPPGEPAHSNGKFSSAEAAGSLQVISAGLRLRPSQVTWEMTRECKWKTVSSRPAKRNWRERAQVSTAEAFHLIEDIAAMRVPLLALTGGDPLCRADLFPVIEFASKRSVRTSLTLLPTPKLDRTVIAELKEVGLMRVGLWLHGPTAELHDAYLGIRDGFRRTLEIIETCHEVQLPVHINTIGVRRNLQDIDSMFELLTRLDVAAWNVFFFVPSNQEDRAEMLSGEETEQVFAKLYQGSGRVHFQVKTTEGQHYQRYVLQQRARETKTRFLDMDAVRCAPKGVNESRGSVFVDYKGEVYPSRFLQVSAGNVTHQALSEVYSESPLFTSLRDASLLKGKCGRCPVRTICGGSRARAYAVTGDLFAAEPSCGYEPGS
jgi:radical SAM protein with 4Fe4S-binding SPASM domain